MDNSGDSPHYRSALTVQESMKAEGQLRGTSDDQRLAGPQRRSLRQDEQQRAEQTASSADARLLHGDIEDALVKFRQLRQKQTTRSAPLMSTDGMLLSDKDSVMARRQDHFIILLNQPLYPPLSTLLSETAAPALILSLKHSQVIE